MDKPALLTKLEALIRFEQHILHKSPDQITAELQAVAHYIVNENIEPDTLIEKALAPKVDALIDLAVARKVNRTLNPS